MQLQAIDYTSATAQEDFVKSLRETGFGVLKNHPIQKTLVSAIYSEWQTFFNSEEKHNYLYNKGTQDGFFHLTFRKQPKVTPRKTSKNIFTIIRGDNAQPIKKPC